MQGDVNARGVSDCTGLSTPPLIGGLNIENDARCTRSSPSRPPKINPRTSLPSTHFAVSATPIRAVVPADQDATLGRYHNVSIC